jgi:hypothetical protein
MKHLLAACAVALVGVWATQADEPALEEGFVSLFNGKDLTGWVGATDGYKVEDGILYCDPKKGGNLMTAKEYDNFILRFEFLLYTNSNNGLGIRAPVKGDAAYGAMELQILDDSGSQYTKLQPYQYHGSIYGVVPAKRGFQKKVGQWNVQRSARSAQRSRVLLNGEVIVDADLSTIKETMDKRRTPACTTPRDTLVGLGTARAWTGATSASKRSRPTTRW